jgi:O-antigen/teichoic acid export membrane protein
MSLANIFDYGISIVMNREVAAQSVRHDLRQAQEHVDLKTVLGSLEYLVIAVSVFAAILVLIASGWFASHWLNVPESEVGAAQTSLAIGAICLCVQRIRIFGMAVLSGRQRQVQLNILTTTFSLLRMVFGFGVVFLYSPTAVAFLATQLTLSVIEAIVFHVMAWRSIHVNKSAPIISLDYIKAVSKPLAVNWGMVTATAFILYTDKMVLSGTVDITTYGQYVLIASVVTLIAGPVVGAAGAFLPRLVGSVVAGNTQELSTNFTIFSTIAAAFCIPPSLGIAVFGDRILQLLLGSVKPISDLWLILTLLAGGGALSAMTRVLHAIQIANNRPEIALKFNVVSALLYTPMCWIAGVRWGPVGTAATWLAFNMVYLPMFVRATKERTYVEGLTRWTMMYIFWPLTIAAVFLLPARSLDNFGLVASLASLAVALGVSTSACLMSNRPLRVLFKGAVFGYVRRLNELRAGPP